MRDLSLLKCPEVAAEKTTDSEKNQIPFRSLWTALRQCNEFKSNYNTSRESFKTFEQNTSSNVFSVIQNFSTGVPLSKCAVTILKKTKRRENLEINKKKRMKCEVKNILKIMKIIYTAFTFIIIKVILQ